MKNGTERALNHLKTKCDVDEEKADRAEHRVARPPRSRRQSRRRRARRCAIEIQSNVLECQNVEDGPADRHTRDDVHPEAVDAVGRERRRASRQAEEQRHHRRPVAAAREEVGHEEPRCARARQDEQRETERPFRAATAPMRSVSSIDEVARRGTLKRRVGVREPAGPFLERADEHRQRDDRPTAQTALPRAARRASAKADRKIAKNHDHEHRPADERSVAVVAAERAEQRNVAAQNRRGRPRRAGTTRSSTAPSRPARHDRDVRAGRTLPAARLEQFFGRERRGREAAHRIAEALRRPARGSRRPRSASSPRRSPSRGARDRPT